jgi:tRNA pseudouridine32 synthase / 23S rRNA pseudouridine746 synthase
MSRSDTATVPPTRDGVGPSCVGLPAGNWSTLLEFLVQRFPAQSAATWHARMAQGLVRDEKGQAMGPDQPYRGHQRIYYYRELATELPIPFQAQVLYRDEDLLVADKPHFLPVVPSGRYLQETLLVRLKRELGLDDVAPIHRIDRDTAGLVMFSLRSASRDAYHALFRNRQVDKTYEAVAPWRGDLQLPLTRSSRIVQGSHFLQQCEGPGEVNAVTHIKLLRRLGALAHYRLAPVTGHRHQLRVHMAALGAPIAGDGIYPVLTPQSDTTSALPLQLLARAIRFTDPLSGTPREFESQRTLALVDDASVHVGQAADGTDQRDTAQ